MKFLILLVCAALTAAFVTEPTQDAADEPTKNVIVHSWPEPGQAGSERAFRVFEQDGMKVAVTVSEVFATRDGRKTRLVNSVYFHDEKDMGPFSNISNVRLEESWDVGGGVGDWMVLVRPKKPLTWGDVHDGQDLSIELKRNK